MNALEVLPVPNNLGVERSVQADYYWDQDVN